MKDKSIVIKGQKYQVKFHNCSCDCLGLTDTKNKQIDIFKHEDEREIKSTIVHELLHAYLYECGLLNYVGNENLVLWFESVFFDLQNKLLSILNFK